MQVLKAGLLFLVMMRVVFSMRRVSSGKFEDFSWQGQPFAVHFQRDKFRITGLTLRIPIADKLHVKLADEEVNRTLIIDGILMLREAKSPQIVREMLLAYLPEAGQKHAAAAAEAETVPA